MSNPKPFLGESLISKAPTATQRAPMSRTMASVLRDEMCRALSIELFARSGVTASARRWVPIPTRTHFLQVPNNMEPYIEFFGTLLYKMVGFGW